MRNTPISEGAICGVAIGAAQSGLRPVVEIMFIDFITLALDQLVNQAAKAHFMSGGQLTVPLVLRTQGGAGQRGGAQHSQSLEAWLTHVPGLKVVMPASAADAAGLLASAIADPNPVVFIENKALYFRREEVPERAAAGADRVARAPAARGGDVTIVALSRMVGEALAAAERLAAEGIEAEVIDPRTLVPLDLEPIVASVRRTGRASSPTRRCVSAASAPRWPPQLQAAAFDHLDAPIERVGAPFTPIPLSPPLEDAYLPGSRRDLRRRPRRARVGQARLSPRSGRGCRRAAGFASAISERPGTPLERLAMARSRSRGWSARAARARGRSPRRARPGGARSPRSARVMAVGDDQDVARRRQLGLGQHERAGASERQRDDALERALEQRAAGELQQPGVEAAR